MWREKYLIIQKLTIQKSMEKKNWPKNISEILKNVLLCKHHTLCNLLERIFKENFYVYSFSFKSDAAAKKKNKSS